MGSGTWGMQAPIPRCLYPGYLGLSAKAVEDVNDVKTSLITTRRIIFTPTVALKDELANTAIQITCYDRNGEIVKRVTSADPGTVEDPEGDDNGTGGSTENTGGQNQGGTQGGDSQGGSQNQGGTDTGGGTNTGGGSDNTGGDDDGDDGLDKD